MKTALMTIAAVWLGIGAIAAGLLWLYGLTQGGQATWRQLLRTGLGWPYYLVRFFWPS